MAQQIRANAIKMPLPIRNSRLQLSQGKIFWREVGQEGTTLLFLHGSCQSSSQWLPIIESLSENYHCLAPDLLGFGESEYPQAHHSIAWQVEYLEEYLKALNLEKVYLVGHSLGAWIATSYALKNSAQVQGLILLAPEGVEVKGQLRRRLWSKWLLYRPSVLFWLLRILAFVAPPVRMKTRIKRTLQYRKRLLQCPTTCHLLFLRRPEEIQQELLQEQLQQLTIPLLVLQGIKDSPQQVTQSQIYADLSEDSKLRLIHQGGNNLPEDLPGLVVQEIAGFIRLLAEVR